MSEYLPTIGLEVHAELKTQTKMFCRCKNDADEARPNVNICPVCLAHPGSLPVINKEAVHQVLRVGTALNGRLATDYTEFDRKNYFYPDLPKGYQISQYEYPLVSGGELNGVAITRVHLEEDTASSIHDDSGATLIDYNRGGVPLMELVTEPVIHSGEQAGEFGRALQTLLRYLGASEANMEKGQMRLEANISVSNTTELGTKVEVKNINSFRAMERAVAFEIERQKAVLAGGGTVVQETRGWDDGSQKTFSQRKKEGSADYRYFPDPDLPALRLASIPEFAAERLAESLPELPQARIARYVAMGLTADDSTLFTQEALLGAFFDEVAIGMDAVSVKTASNYIANDLVKIIRDSDKRDTETIAEIPISAQIFKKIVEMIIGGKVSSRAAKDILAACVAGTADPEAYAKEHSLFQISDTGALEKTIMDILEKNPTVVSDYKAGKQAALEFLVGQGMKALRGAANPTVLREAIQVKISTL